MSGKPGDAQIGAGDEVGDNTTTERDCPVHVLNSAGSGNLVASAVYASGFSGYAITNNVGLGWGTNRQGELGSGSPSPQPIPKAINGLSGTIIGMGGGIDSTIALIQ